MKTKLITYSLGIVLVIVHAAHAASPAASQPASAQSVSEQEAYEIARDAYVFAYPIVTMDVSMRQSINVPDAKTVPLRAPINRFAHARTYPRAEDRDVVRYNFDTLYSPAWIDISSEPIILSVPDTGGRYYLLPMLDMWTDVFCVAGSRTTGTRAGTFALVAPGWKGTLPKGVTRIMAPTSTIWILGRTQTNGPDDYENVHKVQDACQLTPLSQWGKSYAPPAKASTDPTIDNKTSPFLQVNKLEGIAVLGRFAELIAKHPPHANDYPTLFRLRRIGLEPGKPFDASKLNPALVKTINTAAKDALTDLPHHWNTCNNGAAFGTDYFTRTAVAKSNILVNKPNEAKYFYQDLDVAGARLNGNNRYTVTFAKGKTPPVKGFWSLTLYNEEHFFEANPINRYSIGTKNKDLTTGADGSLTIYVQADEPGNAAQRKNWLPSPKNKDFSLFLRAYWAEPAALDGSWTPPSVTRVE